MAWLVFDIGCLECGEPSAVVGVYTTKERANEVAAQHAPRDTSHSVVVLPLPEAQSETPAQRAWREKAERERGES